MTPIETDYLVIGAGAIAMAFVDTLLTDTDDQIVMVDRHHRPGGHWNEAYPFWKDFPLKSTGGVSFQPHALAQHRTSQGRAQRGEANP